MSIPLMEFTVDEIHLEAPAKRYLLDIFPWKKHGALHKMIDDLLDLDVIQPSRTTTWSQAHLVENL